MDFIRSALFLRSQHLGLKKGTSPSPIKRFLTFPEDHLFALLYIKRNTMLESGSSVRIQVLALSDTEHTVELFILPFIAVYADTRLLPFVWIIASLEKMQERYQKQKIREEYKVANYAFLEEIEMHQCCRVRKRLLKCLQMHCNHSSYLENVI